MPVTQLERENTVPELLARAARGDMEAFCLVVSEHQARLLGQALALCGNEATAEDLAQQTWIEAWKSLSRFDHSCRFTTWLYAILLHCHNRIIRRKFKFPIPFASLLFADSEKTREQLLSAPSEGVSPHEALMNKEGTQEWRRAIESLPEIHRQVVLLRFFEDASLEEIATVTGCPLGTVKTRLHHALQKLRTLRKYEDETNR